MQNIETSVKQLKGIISHLNSLGEEIAEVYIVQYEGGEIEAELPADGNGMCLEVTYGFVNRYGGGTEIFDAQGNLILTSPPGS